jgi:rhomboid protease GluP
MDPGISPTCVEEVKLTSLSKEAFLVLSLEAAEALKWHIDYSDENGFAALTEFAEDSWAEEVTVKFRKHHAIIKSECSGKQPCGWKKNQENIDELLNKIEALELACTPDQIAAKVQTVTDSRKTELPRKKPDKGLLKAFLSLFIPVEGYFITPLLINLNVGILLLMRVTGVNILFPDPQSMIMWGASSRTLTLGGEAWRLLTCCFLHFGIMHLLMNMLALYFIGFLLEPYLGKIQFLSAYLLTGICAAIVSLWWHNYGIAAGASGAIFGMYGVFLALLTTAYIDKKVRYEFLSSISLFVLYNLVAAKSDGVDNAAHLGGLVAGMITGYALLPSLKKPADIKRKLGSVAILFIVTAVSAFLLLRKIPNDLPLYKAKMRSFMSLETKALEVLKLPPNTPKAELLYAIKEKGISYWNQNLNITNEIETLDLPAFIKQRNASLRYYCGLRLKSYTLMYKAVAENSKVYDRELQKYKGQIAEAKRQIPDLTLLQ